MQHLLYLMLLLEGPSNKSIKYSIFGILNFQSPFAVSVDDLIISINKSRVVTLYLINHCTLIRMTFYQTQTTQ